MDIASPFFTYYFKNLALFLSFAYNITVYTRKKAKRDKIYEYKRKKGSGFDGGDSPCSTPESLKWSKPIIRWNFNAVDR